MPHFSRAALLATLCVAALSHFVTGAEVHSALDTAFSPDGSLVCGHRRLFFG